MQHFKVCCFNVLRGKDTTFLAHLFKMCAIFKVLTPIVSAIFLKSLIFARTKYIMT